MGVKMSVHVSVKLTIFGILPNGSRSRYVLTLDVAS